MSNIVQQLTLRPHLPDISASKDYHQDRNHLIAMEHILSSSNVEDDFLYRTFKSEGCFDPTSYQLQTARRAFRCTLLGVLSSLSFRQLATRLADSLLFQWFTGYGVYGGIRNETIPSKSTLERFSKRFKPEEIRVAVNDLLKVASGEDSAKGILGLEHPLAFDEIFADTTCIKANIHIPTDWVLLRDAIRSLCKAIQCVRRNGLKHRIAPPETFITKINSLCMAMAAARRTRDAVKRRKAILRKMKRLTQTVFEHGKRYRAVLEENWQSTDLTWKQSQQIIKRIDMVVEQIPEAIRQAHERIIGGRRVKSEHKILSLYEPHTHVIVRGKAGAEVEFGNGLYLAEQRDGLIVDWLYFKQQPPGDNLLVQQSIQRITEAFGPITSFTADRGFAGKRNTEELAKEDILNGIYPKGEVPEFDGKIKELHKRRAQTEGRIAILKNVFLNNPLNCKGYAHRNIAVSFAVFAHNLLSLARKAVAEKLTRDGPPETCAHAA